MKHRPRFLRLLALLALLALFAAPAWAASAPGSNDSWPWSNVINSLAENAIEVIAGSFGVLVLVWGVVTMRHDGETGVKRIAGGILLAAVALGAPVIVGEIASLVSAQI